MNKKIGILTSGGDAPGMNAVIASVAHFAARKGFELVGIHGGFRGLMFLSTDEKRDMRPIDLQTALDIADMRGTYLRTARCKEWPSNPKTGYDAAPLHKAGAKHLREAGVEALIVIGGDGSFQGAKVLYEDGGIPFIGIPGTIDNDLSYTERTLGYDTAVSVCTDAVRSIRATSRSHDRPAIVQVMGRYCGDIALSTARATGSEMVIVPELDWDIDFYAKRLNKLIEEGNTRSTLIMSEHSIETDVKRNREHMKKFDWVNYLRGYGESVGEGEILTADRLATLLKYKGLELAAKRRGIAVKDLPYEIADCYEMRATVIGYTQRGAIPTAVDSQFGFEAGREAVELLYAGQMNQVIGMKQGRVYHQDMETALAMPKTFDQAAFDMINSIKK